MKTKIFLTYALAVSGISLYSMAPSHFNNRDSIVKGRGPASEAVAVNKTQVNVVNNIVLPVSQTSQKHATKEQVAVLKSKLATLEKSLQAKEDLLKKNNAEISSLRDASVEDKAKIEEKIEALQKLIAEQKADIEGIKKQIADADIRGQQRHKEATDALNSVTCKFESKGEKLEADIKKLLEDKEAIFGKMEKLTKDNDDLRAKLDKKEEKKSVDNADLISLMSQMTTMFTTQMQAQMQLQTQMMNMLSQMQFNQAPQYTWDWSQYAKAPYAVSENYNPNFWGIGLGFPGGLSDSQNPYSQMPGLTRQPAQQSDFGFSFGQIPQANNLRGYNFNLAPSEPMLPRMQRQQIPGQQLPNAPFPTAPDFLSA